MKSKDLKNITEAPGDPNAGLVRDPKTGQWAKGNQGGVQFAPNRKRPSDPMNPLGDGGRKNKAGQDTNFKRADQQINQKFGNNDSLAGGSSKIQQFKKDIQQKA